MRIAIFGDIHGNHIGLKAILDDIRDQGDIDQFWLTGDYALGGPGPVEVLEIITGLPNAKFIHGNADGMLLKRNLPGPDEVPTKILPRLIEMNQIMYWTLGVLHETSWLKWIEELPLDHVIPASEVLSILLVHASPGTDEGAGFYPKLSDDEVRELFSPAEQNLIIVGHTHTTQDRRIEGKRIINPGSVGNPYGTDTRAKYIILEIEESAYQVHQHAVEYDISALIQYAEDIRFPGLEKLKAHYTGQMVPGWER